MSKPRAILKIVSMTLLMLFSVAIAYLLTFDLNVYKQQLADNLSDSLNQPVTIGHLSFAMLPEPSIDCRELQIGTPGNGSLEVKAEHLYLKLQLLPLLSRKLEFSEIILQHPLIRLPQKAPQAATGGRTDGQGFDWQHWLQQSQFRKLRLTDAELLLPHRDNQPTSLILQAFLDNFSPGQSGRLTLAGIFTRGQVTTPFNLEGTVSFQQQLTAWRDWEITLRGEFRNLQTGALLAALGQESKVALDGIAKARVSLAGKPATGLQLNASFSGKQLALTLAGGDKLALPQLNLAGSWKQSAGETRFDQLQLDLGEVQLTGSVRHSSATNRLNLDLALAAPLAELARLLPPAKAATDKLTPQRAITAGQLTLTAGLDAGPDELQTVPAWLDKLQLQGSLKGGELDLGTLGKISRLQLQFRQQQGRLQLQDGSGNWLQSRFEFGGELGWPINDAGKIALKITDTLESEAVAKLLPPELQSKIQLTGTLPTSLTLEGPLDEIALKLRSDVKFLQGEFGSLYYKPAGLAGDLSVSGTLRNHQLRFDNAAVSLPPFDLQGSGELSLAGSNAYHARLTLAAIDLQRAQFRSPLLAKLLTRGKLTAHATINGSADQPPRLEGQIDLDDFGVRITRVIADLQHVNGRLTFDENQLHTADIKADLGKSPVQLQAEIADFQHPAVAVHLRAKTLRADELIFPSDQMLLRDLEGKLRIDGSGIDFVGVDVRLDGGTRAHVTGRMEGYHGPHVALDISSDFGNIDEIIGLWQTSQPRPRPVLPADHPLTTTAITIAAKSGKIGPFTFEDADALLQTDGRGHLTILPLHFHHGDGYGVGQVAVDSSRPGPSLLMVSGHVENFDGLAIYRDLLQRDGLVSGVTRGDFYLEGEPGKNFLSTSSGGVSLEINNGILHRLPLISKLFSILNVSQILTLNAPEMSADGMPFKQLSGSFSMHQGVLSTKDLVIHSNSMDMSLVLDQNLRNHRLKGILAVKPLKTVDTLISSIPLVGWVLAGEEKAVLTAQFKIRGTADKPEVTPEPASSIAAPIMGIFVRTLKLPGKMVTDLTDALTPEQQQPAQAPGQH